MHFTIYTDHRPLKYLMNLKDPSSRLARWALSLLEYSFDIEYKPGATNQADALTRLRTDEDIRPPFHIATMQADELIPVILDVHKIQSRQQTDKKIEELKNKEGFYESKNGFVYKQKEESDRRDKLVVPHNLRTKILKMFHDVPTAAHGGRQKTLELIKRDFCWSGMTVNVKRYCQACHSCATHKAAPQRTDAEYVSPPRLSQSRGQVGEKHTQLDELAKTRTDSEASSKEVAKNVGQEIEENREQSEFAGMESLVMNEIEDEIEAVAAGGLGNENDQEIGNNRLESSDLKDVHY